MRACFTISSNAHLNSRATRQIRALIEAGISVTVIHHGDQPLYQPKYPAVTYLNVPKPSAKRGPLHFRQLHSNLAATLRSAKPTCDVFHASDLYALAATAEWANKSGTPYTFDSRELYTHVVGTNGRPWARWTWHMLQKRLLPRARAVFTVSDGIAEFLSAAYDIHRPIVLPNVPDTSDATSDTDVRSTLEIPESTFLAVYAGSVRPNRGCMTALRAVASAPPIHLAFVGNGPLKAELVNESMRLGCADRVHFVAPVQPNLVSAFLSTADVGLSLLPDNCLNHRLALPNKLFEYIAGGVPVVASNLPEMSRLISDHDVGSCVEPSDKNALKGELLRLAADQERLNTLSENCRRAADLLSWDSFKPLFVNTFLELDRT